MKNKLCVKKLKTEEEVIEHVKLITKNFPLDRIPQSHRNHYSVICSTLFALERKSLNESKHLTSGRKLIEIMKQLDQFSKLELTVGSKVAIVNYQLQGDLWGFTTPKTISKISRNSDDDSITQFEFNNATEDVWPRTENAEYNGNYLMNSSFFQDKKSADHAISIVTISCSGNLKIKNHIGEKGEKSIV